MLKRIFRDVFLPQSIASFKEKYSLRFFLNDLLAGSTLAAFSFPLAIAFAIASGVEPIKGLYTAVIAGFLISFLGGSRVQIAGPTGTMAILILNILQKHGFDGLVIAGFIAAVLLIFFGLMRIGTLIKYIPDTVTTGYATAIAITLFSSQLCDLFGISLASIPTDLMGKWAAFIKNLGEMQPLSLVVGAASLGFLIFMRKKYPKFPAAIAVVILGSVFVYFVPTEIMTIGSRFGEINHQFAMPELPAFSWSKAELVFHDAVMMAILIAIESIVSTVVSDGMIRSKTKYDCELVAQGVANLGTLCFGGIPASGSLSRTVASVKMGAKSPFAGMFHAVIIGLIAWLFLPFISFVPMATIAAVLCMLAWNMCEFKHFWNFFRAPQVDLLVLIVTFTLIIFADLMVGVEIGIVLSTSLFIKRMSENENAIKLSQIFSESVDAEAIEKKNVPKQVEVYEINGPFFFGIVERLQDIMNQLNPPPKIFILRMRKVPFVDMTAMRAINELHDKCVKQNTILFLSGVFGQAEEDLRRIGVEKKIGKQNIFRDIDSALTRTRQILKENNLPQPVQVKKNEPTVIYDATETTKN